MEDGKPNTCAVPSQPPHVKFFQAVTITSVHINGIGQCQLLKVELFLLLPDY
jgi:hypothetical protein